MPSLLFFLKILQVNYPVRLGVRHCQRLQRPNWIGSFSFSANPFSLRHHKVLSKPGHTPLQHPLHYWRSQARHIQRLMHADHIFTK
jgi:hypothetical protein